MEQIEDKNEDSLNKSKQSFLLRRGSSRGFNIFKLNSFSEKQRPKLFIPQNVANADALYDIMKNYLEYNEDAFMQSICNHLEFTLARTRFSICQQSSYKATSLSVRDRLIEVWNDTQLQFHQKNPKRAYYFSIEYLLGRTLQNALLNMDIETVVKKSLMKLGMNLENVYDQEHDPGLGNGGLGRLAACFLDSMATLNYPVWGYGLRYTFGIFQQKIVNGDQYEVPDYWLQSGNPWEIPRDDITYVVQFYGQMRKVIENGKQKVLWEKCEKVKAMAYDNPIPGFDTFNTINLRLWKSIPYEEIIFEKFQYGDYYGSVKDKLNSEIITSVLYPNDNMLEGKYLRLKQQYFFISASIQDIIRRFKKDNKDFKDFPKKVAVQLNDTHPSLSIIELLRFLIDIEDYNLSHAWNIVCETFSYTNHTVLPEALEKWSVEMLNTLLPRHMDLIYLVNYFWIEKLKAFYPDQPDKIVSMSLIEEGHEKKVRMSNLSIIGSHKVNGVALLHTDILKAKIFKDFYNHEPNKFINITNGVTPRRWVNQANPDLAQFYTDTLGSSEWKIDYNILEQLEERENDEGFQKKWMKIKNKNKKKICSWVKKNLQIQLNPSALFDVMIKRIHEYKRQLLYCLYILFRYQSIKKMSKSERVNVVPRVFFLGGKAAPGYYIAKKIIKFANSIADLLNNDLETKEIISFVFLPNYRVSLAEKIIPASDLSEHISTAGTEASGTSNMKFQMNGCQIIGTMDGANIEIAEEIGKENMFIFGKTNNEIQDARNRMQSLSYEEYFCQELRDLIEEIRGGLIGDPNNFNDLLGSFTNKNDFYLIGTDFDEYRQTQERVDETYKNISEWARRSIHGAIFMAKFSTDRTITEYATKIWKIEPIQIENNEIIKNEQQIIIQEYFIKKTVNFQRLFRLIKLAQNINMFDNEGTQTYFVNQNLGEQAEKYDAHTLALKFKDFIKEWMVDNEFIYRNQLISNGQTNNYFLEVRFSDIEDYDAKISVELRNKPIHMISIFEKALKDLYYELKVTEQNEDIPDFQLILHSGEKPKNIRNLKSEHLGKVVKIHGIIISASDIDIKGKNVVIECNQCGHRQHIEVSFGQDLTIPNSCHNKQQQQKQNCGQNTYKVVEQESQFIDTQILKIQELPESIPPGNTPKHERLKVQRFLCDQLVPGNRVQITAIYQVSGNKTLKTKKQDKQMEEGFKSDLILLGCQRDDGEGKDVNPLFTPQEEQRFLNMSKDNEIFEKITHSIAPQIFGNDEIKKAIACLLFSGSAKLLPDNTKLRGDINVLLIGDPSTAKSQFLKFVHKTAPICVYTSGKGSSAAGLTASIVQNKSTKQFNLEGGALVLADGGVVCIDEFDKMRAEDRIAIHEAMEQQTISIAKAGITTILNSRTSILAAANPIYGSYQNYKSRQEQIDLQNTILSRFDCIFTVIDIRSVENDRRLAKHVLGTYLTDKPFETQGLIDLQILRRYIQYAKIKCFPRLNQEAAETLQNIYVSHRAKVQDLKKQNKKHIPITVRQLEAIIRLSESISKMKLSTVVTKDEVLIANKIFEVSTMDSLKCDFPFVNDPSKKNLLQDIQKVIRETLPIGQKVLTKNLEEDLESRFQDMMLVQEAIGQLLMQGLLVELSHGFLKRKN